MKYSVCAWPVATEEEPSRDGGLEDKNKNHRMYRRSVRVGGSPVVERGIDSDVQQALVEKGPRESFTLRIQRSNRSSFQFGGKKHKTPHFFFGTNKELSGIPPHNGGRDKGTETKKRCNQNTSPVQRPRWLQLRPDKSLRHIFYG